MEPPYTKDGWLDYRARLSTSERKAFDMGVACGTARQVTQQFNRLAYLDAQPRVVPIGTDMRPGAITLVRS